MKNISVCTALLNPKGSAIIPIVFALGLLSVSMYSTLDVINSNQKLIRMVKQNTYADHIADQFQNALSSRDVCTVNFQGVDVTNLNLGDITNPDDDFIIPPGTEFDNLRNYAGVSIYTKDQEVGTGTLIYKGMRLKKINLDPTHLQILIDFEKKGGYLGSKHIVRGFRLGYQINGANQITECVVENLTLISTGCDLVGASLVGSTCVNPVITGSYSSLSDLRANVSVTAGNQAVFTGNINAAIPGTSVTANILQSGQVLNKPTTIRTNSTNGPSSQFIHQGSIQVWNNICNLSTGVCTLPWADQSCNNLILDDFIKQIQPDGSVICGTTWFP